MSKTAVQKRPIYVPVWGGCDVLGGGGAWAPKPKPSYVPGKGRVKKGEGEGKERGQGKGREGLWVWAVTVGNPTLTPSSFGQNEMRNCNSNFYNDDL